MKTSEEVIKKIKKEKRSLSPSEELVLKLQGTNKTDLIFEALGRSVRRPKMKKKKVDNKVLERIREYLAAGGLFYPGPHDKVSISIKVSILMQHCSAEIIRLQKLVAKLRKEGKK